MIKSNALHHTFSSMHLKYSPDWLKLLHGAFSCAHRAGRLLPACRTTYMPMGHRASCKVCMQRLNTRNNCNVPQPSSHQAGCKSQLTARQFSCVFNRPSQFAEYQCVQIYGYLNYHFSMDICITMLENL
jgi:hypothetical protein